MNVNHQLKPTIYQLTKNKSLMMFYFCSAINQEISLIIDNKIKSSIN